MEGLGAAPSDLPDWLASRGFYVAAAAHANYGRTTMSLASTLNMTTLDEAAARVGPDSYDPNPVYGLIQNHAVGRFLKERGYRYIHIGNWFAPTHTVRLADESLAMPSGSDFETKLEETTFKPTLDDLMGVTDPPAHHILHRRTALWQLREFERVRAQPRPKFVILHILLPHDPYVFDEIGELPDEQSRTTRTEGDKFTRQTTYLNDQIRRIVDELLDVPPDEQPIIVIAADEGPYPARYKAAKETFDWETATTAELETKYGILAAFHLPGDARPGAPAPYPTMSSWNTFRIVLPRYFDAELPLLPDRSFTSAVWKRPYDLTDITDRLPAPYGQDRP
jgi:arylsulfatase A-like enzyme